MGVKTTASDEANKGEKCESEQDARIALLGHFSSKSTNEAVILLTEAFAFFTFLGLILSTDFFYKYYLVIVASGFFAYFASYAFGRLIFWGEHATAISCVEMAKIDEVRKALEKNRAELGLPKEVEFDNRTKYSLNLLPTLLQRLSLACEAYFLVKKQKSRLVKLSYFLRSRKWVLLVFASTAVALIIRYY